VITPLVWYNTEQVVASHQRRLWTPFRSHIQNDDLWLLTVRPTGCPETSVINCLYFLRNNPEELSSHLPRDGSLKSINLSVSHHIPRFQEPAVQSPFTKQPPLFPVTVTQPQCAPSDHIPVRSISILYTHIHLYINITPFLYVFPLALLYIYLLENAWLTVMSSSWLDCLRNVCWAIQQINCFHVIFSTTC